MHNTLCGGQGDGDRVAALVRRFGYLGGVVGLSTAVGPLIGGVLIELAGVHDGWRWVFLVNVFVGAVEVPAAAMLLPRRQEREAHRLDPVGNALLAGTLLLLLVPLVEGRGAGWPAWSWICLAGCLPAGAVLAWWESRLARRGGEPVIERDLLRHRSFARGQLLALLYFGGFTSLFFIISILWQEGLGHSACADHRAAHRRGHRHRGHRHCPVRQRWQQWRER